MFITQPIGFYCSLIYPHNEKWDHYGADWCSLNLKIRGAQANLFTPMAVEMNGSRCQNFWSTTEIGVL